MKNKTVSLFWHMIPSKYFSDSDDVYDDEIQITSVVIAIMMMILTRNDDHDRMQHLWLFRSLYFFFKLRSNVSLK